MANEDKQESKKGTIWDMFGGLAAVIGIILLVFVLIMVYQGREVPDYLINVFASYMMVYIGGTMGMAIPKSVASVIASKKV